MSALPSSAQPPGDSGETVQFVTLRIGGQLIGLPIDRVRDVFIAQGITGVPRTPPSVAGLVNLRGRIVLMLDLAAMLSIAPQPPKGPRMAIGVEDRGEAYGLIVDTVGEVLALPVASGEAVPAYLAESWASYARRLFKLDRDVMIELDLDALLGAPLVQAA